MLRQQQSDDLTNIQSGERTGSFADTHMLLANTKVVSFNTSIKSLFHATDDIEAYLYCNNFRRGKRSLDSVTG